MSITVLEGKRIVLGITGSIAAYKSVELASSLTQAGAEVDVILTEAAMRFISPLSFRSVTGRDAYVDMWSLDDHIRHVRIGEAADMLIIAPATAHTIAKLAHGLADNLLTVVLLATRCPLMIAPAMDVGMYENAATQANLSVLQGRSVTVAGPAEGRMASGLSGFGRMLEPAELIGHIRMLLGSGGSLSGKKVVVTTGPTREQLDPVRFLSNRSSGRQGLALAQAALDAGGEVILISGPIEEEPPIGATHIAVSSALEMSDAVLGVVAQADALLMAAAVADFRPAELGKHKIKKAQAVRGNMVVPLVSNPDILEQVKAQKGKTGRPTVTLGFAAETEKMMAHGQDKLERKGLDYIAINDVSSPDAGFGAEENRIVLVGADGQLLDMPLQSKSTIAENIIRVIAQALESLEPIRKGE